MATPSPPTADLTPPPAPSQQLPLKDIPGGYGFPFFGPIKDRLDFFWFQGEKEFWSSRVKKYNSTVFRTTVPPSPPAFPSNKVIMLLDQKSFPVLFDNDKVYKKDVLLANYMPHTSFYGGIRPCVYLDPSEERHYKLKSFVLDALKSLASKWAPEMQKAVTEVFPVWEEKLKQAKGEGKVDISTETGQVALNVLIRTFFGKDPSKGGLTPLQFMAWLGPQLVPIASVGLPHLFEELVLHNFRIPFLLVSFFYKKIETFVRSNGGELLDLAVEKYGIDRDDALHNIIFFLGFNAFGGLMLLLPSIVSYVGQAGLEVQAEMAKEVREAVSREGGSMTATAIRAMPLIKSAVYEVLRMSPPVPYQYAIAKEDLVVESHDAAYQVKKGEMLGGCQPYAERDGKVFEDPDTYKADRFVGEEGEEKLQYVLWGNGPANGEASTKNKACAAIDVVPLLGQIFLATFFLYYDSFTTLEPVARGQSTSYYLSSLKKKMD